MLTPCMGIREAYIAIGVITLKQTGSELGAPVELICGLIPRQGGEVSWLAIGGAEPPAFSFGVSPPNSSALLARPTGRSMRLWVS
jgi:hypothetical protein